MATVNYQGNGLPDQLPGISDYSMMAIGDYRPANQEAQYRLNNARNGFLQNLAAQEESMKFNEWRNQAGLREAQNQEQMSKAQIGNLDNLTRIATNPQDKQLAIQKALSALSEDQRSSIAKQQTWLVTNGKPMLDEIANTQDPQQRQQLWSGLKQALGDSTMPDKFTQQSLMKLNQIYEYAKKQADTPHQNAKELQGMKLDSQLAFKYDELEKKYNQAIEVARIKAEMEKEKKGTPIRQDGYGQDPETGKRTWGFYLRYPSGETLFQPTATKSPADTSKEETLASKAKGARKANADIDKGAKVVEDYMAAKDKTGLPVPTPSDWAAYTQKHEPGYNKNVNTIAQDPTVKTPTSRKPLNSFNK